MDTKPEKIREHLIAALSDAMFVAPAVHSAGTFFRRRNNTFFYHFNHQTKGGMYAKVNTVLEKNEIGMQTFV